MYDIDPSRMVGFDPHADQQSNGDCVHESWQKARQALGEGRLTVFIQYRGHADEQATHFIHPTSCFILTNDQNVIQLLCRMHKEHLVMVEDAEARGVMWLPCITACRVAHEIARLGYNSF